MGIFLNMELIGNAFILGYISVYVLNKRFLFYLLVINILYNILLTAH